MRLKKSKSLKKFSAVDPFLLFSTFALIILGMVMVYSASSLIGIERHGDGLHYLKRHLAYVFAGLGIMAILCLLKTRGLRHIAIPGLFGTGILLLLTSFPSIGITAKNATRWIAVGGFTFQPSEFVKPFLILYVAAYISKRGSLIKDFRRGVLPLLLTVGLFLLLILRQPDFGTTVVLAITVGVMLFVGGMRISHFSGLFAVGMAASAFLIYSAPYRRARLLAFLNPWDDPQGSGFQIIQSFIAFNSGGIQGQGLGDGAQKLLYLPEAHTDFIYSVIAEELGLFGAVFVIVAYAILVTQGLRLVIRVKDPFASLLALGLTTMIGIQAILNMAVSMGMVPTKGMTLPLVSYGGSSLIATMASIGIVFSLSSTVGLSGRMAKRKTK